MTAKEMRKGKNGKIDPTLNVKELVDLQMKRQDDLRDQGHDYEEKLREAEASRINELLVTRSGYEEKLREAESKRIDAIRVVDVNAVSVANERAVQQAGVLANQVVQSADTLRGLVATTASTIAEQLAQITASMTGRLAAVEKAQYEGQGTKKLSDPMLIAVVSAAVGLLVYLFTHH